MTLDDGTDSAGARLPPSSGSHIAQGNGSVVVGGANKAAITTNVTQDIRQFLLIGRRVRPSLEEAAKHLEAEVHRQWSDEAIHLQVSGDHRLPVRWAPVRARLCAGVVEARRWMAQRVPTVLEACGARWATSDAGLAGADLDLVDVWMTRSPTRRLVMLGEAGSGKSELMIRTLIALVARRAEFDGLVPVLIPAAAWNSGSVEAWLVDWLVTNYRFLAAAYRRSHHSYARELLHANKIALILDGLDELPPTRREIFVSQLSLELEAHPQWAVLLTSRPVEFSAVAFASDVPRLGGAVGVKLLPQRADDVIEYLKRRSLTEGRWNAVEASAQQGGVLAGVLETPLMAMLADTVYNSAADPKPDPAQLLSFDAKTVEQHLLDSYVEARFHDERRWRLADAKRWLGFLASTLNSRANSVDLAWWNLRPTITNKPGSRRPWTGPAMFAAIVAWTAVSGTVFNGWFYQDLGYGAVAGARVAAAAAICYLAVLILTRSNLAGLLAALGAYIAGTVTASYDLAIAAAIAGGFAWRPLVVEHLRRWHCLVFGGVVATASALIQGDDPPSNHPPGSPSWTQGFGSGFSDGWTTRGDEVVNGWLLSATLAGALLWAAARSAPRAADDRGYAAPRIRRFGPAGYAFAVGVVVAALDSLANGVRPDVTHGWMTGPADGFAVGSAVWCLATVLSRTQHGHPTTSAHPGRPRRWRSTALHPALLLGAAALVLHGLSYNARTDLHHVWHRAAAEALGVAVSAWFVAHPSRFAATGSRATGRIGLVLSAVVVGSTSGYLDAVSVGWSRGVITGLSIGLVVLYARLRIPAGDPDGAMRDWLTRPLDAGVLVTVVYGLAAGFAYGLLVGIIFGLAVQVARDASSRHFPSRGPRVSWPGAIGGAVLGTLAAVAAGFSGITVAWLVPIGLTTGVATAITFGAQGITVPDDVVMSPRRLLRLDRVTFVVVLAIVAVAHSLAASTRAVAAGGSVSIGVFAGVSTFLTYGLTAGLLIATAQARYGTFLLWRLTYAARGQLPWRLMAFLDTAHRRRILRQNGANYQFRHQFLQDRLADFDR